MSRLLLSKTIAPAVGSTDALLSFNVGEHTRIMVHIEPVTNALDAFVIKAKGHPSGTYETLYSSTADYTSPAGILLGTSGDLSTQAAGTTGWFIMDVRGIEAIQLLASSDTGAATLTVYVGGQ